LEEHLNFPTNSYHLDEKAKNFLDSIAMEIESFQPTTISIAGHTDNIGSFEVNQILSLHRAQAVFDYLSLQVDFTKVDVKINGYAATKPIADGSGAKDNALNRRVEIIME
jgi:outer membrane protein OmpA-like peptidoglycan-associated protein